MAATMTEKTVGGTATAGRADRLHQSSARLAAISIILTVQLPEQPEQHQFAPETLDMVDTWTEMVMESGANRQYRYEPYHSLTGSRQRHENQRTILAKPLILMVDAVGFEPTTR